LGIGDWAQSPIPNPQSPIPNPHIIKNSKIKINYKIIFLKLIINKFKIKNNILIEPKYLKNK
jgi:hypothetical protein